MATTYEVDVAIRVEPALQAAFDAALAERLPGRLRDSGGSGGPEQAGGDEHRLAVLVDADDVSLAQRSVRRAVAEAAAASGAAVEDLDVTVRSSS